MNQRDKMVSYMLDNGASYFTLNQPTENMLRIYYTDEETLKAMQGYLKDNRHIGYITVEDITTGETWYEVTFNEAN